jgi:hypothetical protein
MRLSPHISEGSQAVVSAFEGPLINGIENRPAILDDEGKLTRLLALTPLMAASGSSPTCFFPGTRPPYQTVSLAKGPGKEYANSESSRSISRSAVFVID